MNVSRPMLFFRSGARSWRGTALCAMLVAAAPLGVAHAQWAQEGAVAAKTYANSAEAVLSRHNAQQLAPRWQMMIGQFYASSATEADGRLFTCSNLYGSSALAPTTGEFLWSRSNTAGGDCGNPALSQGVAFLASSSYTPSNRNLLTAVDQATGQAQWTAELPAGPDYLGVGFGPAVDGGRVFLSTGRDAIVAVDASSGLVLWQASTGGGVVLNNDVAVADGRVFVTTWHECCESASRQLFAFEAVSGAPLWVAEVDGTNMQHAAMALGRRVIVGSDSGIVRAFAARDGRLLWSRALEGYLSAPLVGQGARVYAVSGNRQVQALDAATGEVVWRRALPGTYQVASNMAWANGALYVTVQDFSGDKRLAVLNAATGHTTAAVPLSIRGSFTKLSVSDGQVYLSSEGQLTALGL